MKSKAAYKVWIDLDNSPHVPFFKPIIRELSRKGSDVMLTIREHAQTVESADYHGLHYRKIGKHYGKNKMIKVIGTFFALRSCCPMFLRTSRIWKHRMAPGPCSFCRKCFAFLAHYR